MKLEQIKQILTLAETGSFTETARRLYLSQPNLSMSVKRLEEELGMQIFQRTSSGLRLTPFGTEYIRHLGEIRDKLDTLDDFCRRYPSSQRTVLNVAVTKCNWVNDAFARCINSNEGRELQFSLYNTEQLELAVELVYKSVCEIAVISLHSGCSSEEIKRYRSMGLEYTKLHSAPLHIMLGRHNPLYSTEGPISLKALSDFPYVNYGSPKEMDSISELLAEIGLTTPFRSVISVNTNSALYHVVSETAAFTISANTLGGSVRPGIRAFPLADSPYYIEYGWLKQQQTPLSPQAADFLTQITRTLSPATRTQPDRRPASNHPK